MEEPRKDLFGQELNIDDIVIYGTSTGTARGFEWGKIVKYTPKKIVVKKCGKKLSWGNQSQLYPEQVVKIDPEMALLKVLRD